MKILCVEKPLVNFPTYSLDYINQRSAEMITAATTMASLSTLPEDILLLLVTSLQDLSSHLAFSTACQRISALYDNTLWRRIALSNGLGRPLDLSFGDVPWRTICATAVAHSTICKLPDCSSPHLNQGKTSFCSIQNLFKVMSRI